MRLLVRVGVRRESEVDGSETHPKTSRKDGWEREGRTLLGD